METGERGEYINVGHFFLAIDPVAFRGEPGAFESSLDRLVAFLRATPPVDPDQPVLVPGDPEKAAWKERTMSGEFPLPNRSSGRSAKSADPAGPRSSSIDRTEDKIFLT